MSVLVFFLFLLAGVPHNAQGQGATSPGQVVAEDKVFDVITIKKSGGADGGMGLGKSTPDTILIMNTPLRSLIAHAYSIKQNAIVGGPSWLESEEFDIEAKVLPDANGRLPQLNREEIESRFKTMLRDRFQFASHFEMRKVPAYELSVSSGGSKLKAAIPGNTYADGVKGPDGRTGAGLRIVENHVFTGQGIPVAEFADTLSDLLDRTVIDLTNRTGLYESHSTFPLSRVQERVLNSLRTTPCWARNWVYV